MVRGDFRRRSGYGGRGRVLVVCDAEFGDPLFAQPARGGVDRSRPADESR